MGIWLSCISCSGSISIVSASIGLFVLNVSWLVLIFLHWSFYCRCDRCVTVNVQTYNAILALIPYIQDRTQNRWELIQVSHCTLKQTGVSLHFTSKMSHYENFNYSIVHEFCFYQIWAVCLGHTFQQAYHLLFHSFSICWIDNKNSIWCMIFGTFPVNITEH